MKILGVTRDGYILEANTEEVANLLGCSDRATAVSNALIRTTGDGKYATGSVIKVHEMYLTLHKIAKLQNEMKTTQERIFNVAHLLDWEDPFVDGVSTAVKNAMGLD